MGIPTSGLAFEERFVQSLREQMQKEVDAVAEPIIKKALADIEMEMRKRMGSLCIAVVNSSFSMERYGNDLRIIVKIDPPKNPTA